MDRSHNAAAIATEALARELGCDPLEIAVVEVTPVTWPNSALGCPRHGRMYLDVLTPGYRVRLRRAEEDYTLHTDSGRRAVRCQNAGTGLPGTSAAM